MFPIISIFPKFFEIFFAQIFKDSNFLYILVFHCVFFRTFESVKVHELGSLSSYSNIFQHQQIDTKSGPRPTRILYYSFSIYIIKFDLIQFCSSNVFNVAWYFSLGYSHSSVTSNQITIFYGFGKIALF